MNEETARELQAVLDGQGYVVFNTAALYKIGDIIKEFYFDRMVQHPFKVIGASNRDEFLAQQKFFFRDWNGPWHGERPYYYRAITD